MSARRWAIAGAAVLVVLLAAACNGSKTSPSTPPSTPSTTVAPERSTSTAPGPSAATPLPSPSDLVATLPAPVPTAKAPSVVGQPLDEARLKLQRMGYVVTADDPIQHRTVSDDSQWQVVEQSQSGSTVRLGVQKYSDVPDGGSDVTDKD